MLRGLWTIGIKVADLERELAFHRRMGHPIVLDETIELGGRATESRSCAWVTSTCTWASRWYTKTPWAMPLPVGIAHAVYRSDDFDRDVARRPGSRRRPARRRRRRLRRLR